MQKWHLKEIRRDGSAQTFVYETDEDRLERIRRAANTHRILLFAYMTVVFIAFSFSFWVYATGGY